MRKLRPDNGKLEGLTKNIVNLRVVSQMYNLSTLLEWRTLFVSHDLNLPFKLI